MLLLSLCLPYLCRWNAVVVDVVVVATAVVPERRVAGLAHCVLVLVLVLVLVIFTCIVMVLVLVSYVSCSCQLFSL